MGEPAERFFNGTFVPPTVRMSVERLISIAGSLASIASLALTMRSVRSMTVGMWIVAGIAVVASLGLAYYSWLLRLFRMKTLPHLIQLKGLCAKTNDLNAAVAMVPSGTLKSPSVWPVIKAQIQRAQQRASDLANSNRALEPVAEKLFQCLNDGLSEEDVRAAVADVFARVDRLDRAALRRAGVADLVYPGEDQAR